MKKFVIVGSGTAGLIAAAMIKTYWEDRADISLYYDKSKGNISVGESTTPYIHAFLSFFGISEKDIIRDLDVTIKLGINFKNWIPNTEYFHGFGQVSYNGKRDDSSATYSILNDVYDGALLYNSPTKTLVVLFSISSDNPNVQPLYLPPTGFHSSFFTYDNSTVALSTPDS